MPPVRHSATSRFKRLEQMSFLMTQLTVAEAALVDRQRLVIGSGAMLAIMQHVPLHPAMVNVTSRGPLAQHGRIQMLIADARTLQAAVAHRVAAHHRQAQATGSGAMLATMEHATLHPVMVNVTSRGPLAQLGRTRMLIADARTPQVVVAQAAVQVVVQLQA